MRYDSIATCLTGACFLVFLGTTGGPIVVVSQDAQNNWKLAGTLGFNGTLAGTFNAAGLAPGVGNGLVQLVGVSINSSANNPQAEAVIADRGYDADALLAQTENLGARRR